MKRYHLGRKISFVCVATGKPRPQIIWLKDGLELNSYSGYEHEGVSIPGVSIRLFQVYFLRCDHKKFSSLNFYNKYELSYDF